MRLSPYEITGAHIKEIGEAIVYKSTFHRGHRMSELSYLLPECPTLSTHFVLICPNLCTPLYPYVRILPISLETARHARTRVNFFIRADLRF